MRYLFRKTIIFIAICSVISVFSLIAIRSTTAAMSPVQAGRGERTLILDPGHGGADGGAISITGKNESEINLSIAKKAQKICGLFGIPVIMTRESESIDYPNEADTIHKKKVFDTKARVALIEKTENAALISIHQNNFTSESVSGAQTLFTGSELSKELADCIQENFVKFCHTNPKRGVSRISDSVYLMSHTTCPAVLVECGFLSNTKEENLLLQSTYQTKIAACVISGFLNFISANE